MVKLVVIITLVTMSLTTEGSFLFPTLFRGDPYPDPKDVPPTPSNVVLNTIEQQLDNFDPTNENTWEQRYYSNDEFYQPGGPVFVFLAGEWEISPYRLTTSLMADIADDLNGIIFYLEHRFYGQSRPTPDTSNENLRFLTVEQALADVAHFVEHVTSETPGASNSSVIVVGGHYSASLAVWFRQKYPHLSTGVWASSAPLQALVNHQQYKELAGASYRRAGGDECYRTLEGGFSAIEQYFAANRNDEIADIFSACQPIRTEADKAVFLSIISELYAIIPQFDQIYSVRGVCDLITEGYVESEVERIARHVDELIEEYFPTPCVPSSYDYLVEQDTNTSWEHPVNIYGVRPYSYQLCSQFGWFHSSNSQFQPFGSSFGHEWFYSSCADVFGDGFSQEHIDENIERFNTVFGDIEPGVTNTLFVHGELDPWRTIGRQTRLNPSSPAIVIRGASQGNDLGPITDSDSSALVSAKQRIISTITQWIENDD